MRIEVLSCLSYLCYVAFIQGAGIVVFVVDITKLKVSTCARHEGLCRSGGTAPPQNRFGYLVNFTGRFIMGGKSPRYTPSSKMDGLQNLCGYLEYREQFLTPAEEQTTYSEVQPCHYTN